jgi:hypothetical protein
MGLGLNTSTSDGDFETRPYVQFDAKAGRWFKVDRVQGSQGWETIKEDVTQNFAAVFDMANIEVGWINFTNQGPNLALVPLGQELPAKPSKDHKQGFRMMIYSQALGDRELTATAKVMLAAIDQMHDAYTAAPEAGQGKLPVLRMTGVQVVESKTPKGTNRNYQPVFAIAGWVDRPPALALKPTASAAPPAQQEAPKGATPVGPPPAQPAAQPAPAFDPNNFG